MNPRANIFICAGPATAGNTNATYADEESIEIEAEFVLHRQGPLPVLGLRHYASPIA